MCIRRFDFEKKTAIGKQAQSILYNPEVTSTPVVEHLYRSGSYQYDNRVVVVTKEQADALLPW